MCMMNFILSTVIVLVEIVRTSELSINPPECSLNDNLTERDAVKSPDQLSDELGKSGQDTPSPFEKSNIPSDQNTSSDTVSKKTEQDENMKNSVKSMKLQTHERWLLGDVDVHVKFRWYSQPDCSKSDSSSRMMNFDEENIRPIIEIIRGFLGASGDTSVDIGLNKSTIKEDDKATNDIVSGKDKSEPDDAVSAKSDKSEAKKGDKMDTGDDEGIADDK